LSPLERFSQNFNKLYYSIGEAAEIFGVNTSLIRFWEKEFDQIKPIKNAKGNRKFTPKDLETLSRIYDLVKVKGFTLEGAKKELKKKRSSDFDYQEFTPETLNDALILKLKNVREQALRLKELL
jgi:DNA-binding transcriptional MerR regulator